VKKKILIYVAIGLGVAILLYLYIQFIYIAAFRNYSDIKKKLVIKQKELKQAQELLARYDDFKARASEIKLATHKLEKSMPNKPRIPELLKNITLIATNCELQDFQFVPGKLVDKKTYAQQNIRVKFNSGYHSLGKFVSELIVMPRIVNIKFLNVSSVKKPTNKESINIEILLETYVYYGH